jgi:hypothetical protein
MADLHPVNCGKQQYAWRFWTVTTVVIIVLGMMLVSFIWTQADDSGHQIPRDSAGKMRQNHWILEFSDRVVRLGKLKQNYAYFTKQELDEYLSSDDVKQMALTRYCKFCA